MTIPVDWCVHRVSRAVARAAGADVRAAADELAELNEREAGKLPGAAGRRGRRSGDPGDRKHVVHTPSERCQQTGRRFAELLAARLAATEGVDVVVHVGSSATGHAIAHGCVQRGATAGG